MDFVLILLIGWLVSFLGQLPLGTMSITATHIAILESFKNAWWYAIGVAIIEIARNWGARPVALSPTAPT